jgi:hypothetical protein
VAFLEMGVLKKNYLLRLASNQHDPPNLSLLSR